MKIKTTRQLISSLHIICIALALPLPAQTPQQKSIPVTTQVQVNPPSFTFTWQPLTGVTGIQVYRKAKSAASWGSVISSLPGTAISFTDTTVSIGGDYEYRIYCSGTVAANTYLYAGIEVPPVDYRGKLILLVDSMFAVPLQFEIDRLISDITGDGWVVLRHDVSRFINPPVVKTIIQTEYNSDPQEVKCIFLLGHIPVPYSGLLNPDGHPDHKGAWPADGYYADFTTNWTDQYVYDTTASRVQNRNVPGDGKFDPSTLSNQIELQVGRVDFYNLPTFSANEMQLMKQYLDKNHDYRHKVINPHRRALIDDNFGYFSGEAFAAGAWRNFTAMFAPSEIVSGDYFSDMANDSYLWSYGCGAGSYTNCSGVGNTAAFAANDPKTVFTMLFGSYFGDWDSQNNLLRAPLASEGWGLACSWSGRPHHIYHHMALGEHIGYSIWRTMGNTSTYESGYGAGMVSIALMGDPSLRMHTVASASNLQATFSASQVHLSWNPSPDTVVGYYIFRMDKISGQFLRITPNAITTTTFADLSPANGTNSYMVRAVKLEHSNSGSYYNMSQGIFDSVQTNISIQSISALTLAEFKIWPNPATSEITIELSLQKGAVAEIRIFDVTGREALKDPERLLSAGRQSISLDINQLTPGIYICSIRAGEIRQAKKFLVL